MMASGQYKRKLSAILSADVAGYSRLMGQDEDATVSTLTTYRAMIANLINEHRGRVVDTPGDNVLAEFSSVVDALRAAWDIQKETKNKNVELSENRKMNFRIGVNLGDVIEEQGRIYGDGVNIAARIESLADPGGIYISGTVYDHVRNKLPFRYDYKGEQTVKNIKEPVRVYRLITDTDITEKEREEKIWSGKRLLITLSAASFLIIGIAYFVFWKFYWQPSPTPTRTMVNKEKFQAVLPDKASIAVLPFENLSGNKEQEYLSDGITNDIITDLSRFKELAVIASNSVFTYKGKSLKVEQIGKELGVRYILEGSIQKSSETARINVQLIDSSTQQQLWAERYERTLDNLFALQDEIVQIIVGKLAVKIDAAERQRVMRKKTESLVAYDYLLRGLNYLRLRTRSANHDAHQMFMKAIELDPYYVSAYVGLGRNYLSKVSFGWTEFPVKTLEQAEDLAKKALRLDESDAEAHALFGNIKIYQGEYDLAIGELQRAIELNPNNALAFRSLGTVMLWSGKPEEAIQALEAALKFDPYTTPGTLMFLGLGYYLKGLYADAIRVLELSASRHPDFAGNHIALAAAYAKSARHKDAVKAGKEVLRLDPFFELDSYGTLFRNPEHRAEIVEGLRKAGLK